MKLSVCIDSIYPGVPAEKAAEDVLRLGFDTIEFWGWWNKDIEALERLHKENGLTISAFCTDFISLVDEKQRENYIDALKKTIATAKRLGTKVIISQVGSELPIPRQAQRKTLTEGLKQCAPLMEESGITLTIEPLNTRVDHAGYYLASSDECAEILREVDSPNVKMLFDVYHQQITEGDICRRISEYAGLIGHFHTAGNPGRHELYNSELDYGRVFRAIEESGYTGYVGLEYKPADEVEKGLKHARETAAEAGCCK